MLSEYKVLVLDDHEFQCAQMSGLLEEAGFTQVDTAHTAEQALTLARHHAYHLILMDLSMPGMDGVQLINELAQLRLNYACHHDRLLAPHHEQRQPHGQEKAWR